MKTKEYTPRLKEFYFKTAVPELMKTIGCSNIHMVPRMEKIVVNVGLSESKDNIKVVDIALAEIAAITGRKPKVCKSKKSISNFKIRQGYPIGIKCTLRGDIMYEFFDKLVNISIPRIRDFRGLEPNSFDGQGNYNLGLTEQYIFPEINVEKSDKARGMNITIVTTSTKDEDAREMLRVMGMPFKKRDK